MKSQITRRDFLKTSAAAAIGASLASRMTLTAAERTRSIGANDRIRIGIIGCGHRTSHVHLPAIQKSAGAENLELVAVCDPWRLAREEAAGFAKESLGATVRQCRNHRELLALPDVDAVIISSPDHWHATQLEDAARAGKHIYVEKPMAIELDELNRAYEVASKSGLVIQVGTQTRSTPNVEGCREFYKTGKLGAVSRIEQVRSGEKPYWYGRLKKLNEVKEADLDWKEFTKGRTQKPFDPVLLLGWYGYWEFSQGPVPQLGVHFLDTVHYITGLGFPETCVCLGGTYTWKDEYHFTAPDQMQALWHYPEGVMVSYLTNFGNTSGECFRFCGDKGTLETGRVGGEGVYSAKGGPRRDGSIRGENKVAPIERDDNWVNWFRCMRSGATPNTPLSAGYQHSIASIMAVTAYEKGRRTRFNPQKRQITLD
jgi:predicted dehydrogenase